MSFSKKSGRRIEPLTRKSAGEVGVSWANFTKLFTAVIFQCYQSAGVLVPGRPFQPSLMFVSKTRRLAKGLPVVNILANY
jgi:hypothetical protein